MAPSQDNAQAAASESREALLSFFLGPVQPFIAGARSVRDLWTGSYLLAWLTFAATRKVREAGAVLISPSLDDAHPLQWSVEKRGAAPPGVLMPCIPNRFIARIPAGTNAHDLAGKCEMACRIAWLKICTKVRDRINREIVKTRANFSVPVNGRPADLLASRWDRLWKAQIRSFFEIKTAVLFPEQLTDQLRRGLLDPVAETKEQATMDILFGLMDARKSAQHVPNYRADGDVPQKCTLLGTYEQMGPALLDQSRAFWRVFAEHIRIDGTRVRVGERLCAVSLVKRFAWPAYFAPELRQSPDELSYSDTATVAAGCWLPAETEAPEEGVNWRRLRRWSGQWLHWSRRDQEKDETPPSPKVWSWLQDRKRQLGPPPTYYAILMADADKLGDKIALKGQRVSRALTQFALHAVRGIVESSDHRGELIYSGGDDTLALLPTETAVACALAVQRGYVENWQMHFPGEEAATISMGLAVVHHKEDLRFALEAARGAEHAAKGFGRNALGLTVCRRSGEHTSAVLGWDQAEDLQALSRLFGAGFTDRWAYKLRAVLPTFEGMPWEGFSAELRRLVGRVETPPAGSRDAFEGLVTTLGDKYITENRKASRNRPLDKPLEAHAMADFVTLCQTASFLARGRDAR